MKRKPKHKMNKKGIFCIQGWFNHVLTDADNDLTILQNESETST